MEKELRKSVELRGTEVLLGNGEKWVVPFLPFGSKGKVIMTKLDGIGKEFPNPQDAVDAYVDLLVSALQINYPKLTKEQADAEGLFDMGLMTTIIESLIPTPKKV